METSTLPGNGFPSSTAGSPVENQRFEINHFCEKQEIVVNRWIEETVSGSKNIEERQLGKLLKKMKKDDILICSELSRLGRNLLMIMGVLNECMNRDIKVWTIKDNYRLGSDINSKVLAFAFGLSAEIERNLISQRTKEALARKKAEGVILGRPVGRKSAKTKLTGQEKKIKELLDKRVSHSAIARILGVHRLTVAKFVKERMVERSDGLKVLK
ncbi:master DNA invertase Mpi family serine-type recombinase [Cruoricaptor ignavus]|uniref:Master DNA invertase Mpi family serine-type recombinase n=1 Tax=Cruoricaptor ignavus TaxID=1118202 RepID=A0A7M1T7F2_9FLAO|nr:master DNA invertase Mpi family serine-type recombinase [Cruoricaptor ignavus]